MNEKETFKPLFTPQTIALIGASNIEGKMGNLFIRHLLDGFPGKIFPVHPTAKEVAGLPAYPDITEIPEPIDLAIPLIPGKLLHNMVKNCSKDQIKFLLVIPSGFGEVPNGGKEVEGKLIRLAKERGMRVIGPNTVGILNCPYGLNASMIPDLPRGKAGFSCITQSGGFGMAVYMYTQNHQLGLAKLCDLGNTADVSVSEILDFLANDTDTRIIGSHLESVPDEEAFLTQACKVAKKKPFILTKLSRTPAGQRASFAHIGIIPDGLKMKKIGEKQEGSIILAKTGIEMLHIAKAMSWQPLPKGNKVGIITGSGGVGAELADLCVEHGLEVPEFSQNLQNAMRPYLPSYAGLKNPVDLTPLWWEYYKIYPPLIKRLFSTREVDILIITVIDIATTQDKLMNAIQESITSAENKKPIYIYWASTHSELENMQIIEEGHIPCYSSTLETVRVAAAITRYTFQTTLA